MPRLLGSPLALVFALALQLPRAGAEAGLTLRWSGPADCAQPADMEAQVAALLPPGSALDPARAFEVAIETLPAGGYRLQLREPSADTSSVRVLGSCAEAAEAAAVLIALALDGGTREAEVTPEPPPASIPAEQPAAPPAPEPPGERGSWTLSAAALGDVRSLPDPSVGVMLGAGWSLRALRLGWYLRYLPPQSADSPPSGTSAKFDLYAAALNGAYLWSARMFAFGPALELELGYLHGRSRGVPNQRDGGASWALLAGGAQGEVQLHTRVALQCGVLLGVPLWHPEFALAPNRALFRADSLVFRWFLGVGFRFGPTG